VLTIICTAGTIRFTPENRPDKLWIPWNSDFVKDSDWLRVNFPSPIRFHFAIITAEDVLQPRVIQLVSYELFLARVQVIMFKVEFGDKRGL